jgi:hypothetical protein
MHCTYRENDILRRARNELTSIEWRSVAGADFRWQRPLTFQGPVAMLIDARTFSAAEDTAAVFQLMRRGVIVGSASGGSTGQPWSLELPGGGKARICVKRDSFPDGTTFVGTGIIPDIEVPLTIEDVRAGRDAALERALLALAMQGGRDRPMQTPLDDSLLEAAARCLDGQSVRALGQLQLPASAQSRLELLAQKSKEGQLTDEEAAEYRRFIELGNLLSRLLSKAQST